MARRVGRLPRSETCRDGTTPDRRCPWEDRCDEQRRLDERGSPGRQGIVPPVASAQIIDLNAARLALERDAARAPPTTLGTVPLAFRQWRDELERRAPQFPWTACAAAPAPHAL